MIRHVPQEDQMGCAVASLAMVIGLTYQEAAERFGTPDTKYRGVTYYWWMEALAQSGWSYQMLWRTDQLTENHRKLWPPKPWAPVHLCQIQTPQGAHMIVMREDGIVLDPALPHPTDPFRLDLTRYSSVNYVAGLFPVK